MKIWIGCDHAGYERKQEVIALLKERQLEVEDCGCNGERDMKIYRIPRLCLTNDNLRALGLQYVPVVKNGRGLKSYRRLCRPLSEETSIRYY
mgnify:CR=1 FL=1